MVEYRTPGDVVQVPVGDKAGLVVIDEVIQIAGDLGVGPYRIPNPHTGEIALEVLIPGAAEAPDIQSLAGADRFATGSGFLKNTVDVKFQLVCRIVEGSRDMMPFSVMHVGGAFGEDSYGIRLGVIDLQHPVDDRDAVSMGGGVHGADIRQQPLGSRGVVGAVRAHPGLDGPVRRIQGRVVGDGNHVVGPVEVHPPRRGLAERDRCGRGEADGSARRRVEREGPTVLGIAVELVVGLQIRFVAGQARIHVVGDLCGGARVTPDAHVGDRAIEVEVGAAVPGADDAVAGDHVQAHGRGRYHRHAVDIELDVATRVGGRDMVPKAVRDRTG